MKVVSERLGHATPTFTIETYQHVPPGMQADAARLFEQLFAPAACTEVARLKRRKEARLNPVEAHDNDEGPGH